MGPFLAQDPRWALQPPRPSRLAPETPPTPPRGLPPPLPGLAAALTMTAVGRGRVPPAPFLCSLSRRPGRGAQLLPLRPWLGPSGSAPLPAASDAHCAQRPQVRSTPVPAALSQPRAHGGTFIPARRRRPLAAPKRRASTRDVSAHGPGCSTRSLFFFVIFGRKREKLGRWRAAGLPMEARRGWNGNLGI